MFTLLVNFQVGSLGMNPFPPKRISVIFFNEEGKITNSLYATDLASITDFAHYKNHYYLASFINPYLARVKAS